MILVWIYFVTSIVIFVLATFNAIQYLMSRHDVGFQPGASVSKWFWPFVSCFGLLGILASAPGVIFHQPTWLIDKVFWLISRL